ncbi:Octanoyltransferase [subsurface metagenome]
MARLEVKGECKGGYTGVWIGEDKIASIGVGVKKWVTYHGLALNVSINLSYFSLINSCGLDKRITSITKILSSPMEMDRVKTALVDSFCEVFERIPKVVNGESQAGKQMVVGFG